MTMLERKIRKKIEWAFYNYDSLKESAKEYIVEIAESQIAVNYDKLPVQSSNDNSIERAIINGIDGLAVLNKKFNVECFTSYDAIRVYMFICLVAEFVEEKIERSA